MLRHASGEAFITSGLDAPRPGASSASTLVGIRRASVNSPTTRELNSAHHSG